MGYTGKWPLRMQGSSYGWEGGLGHGGLGKGQTFLMTPLLAARCVQRSSGVFQETQQLFPCQMINWFWVHCNLELL